MAPEAGRAFSPSEKLLESEAGNRPCAWGWRPFDRSLRKLREILKGRKCPWVELCKPPSRTFWKLGNEVFKGSVESGGGQLVGS
jgi:hypothetical protein